MSDSSVKFPRAAKGKRPQFLDSPDLDQMMTFMLELTTEVAVLSERLNTVERLLDAKGTINRQDIENYTADAAAAAERSQARQALVKRVLRMHGEK